MSNNFFDEIPDLPEFITNAGQKDGKLVLFIGSGVSQQVGYPSWGQWTEKILNKICKSSAKFDYLTKKNIAGLDLKTQLSIAQDSYNEYGSFKDLAKDCLGKNDKEFDVYAIINKSEQLLVTVNYDSELNPKVKQGMAINQIERISEPENFPESLSKNQVIHLHGSVEDSRTMIITTNDYLEHYSKPQVTKFLEILFSKYNVLFLGIGFSEMEIIEQIFRHSGKNNDKEEKHCLLLDFFSDEREKFDLLTKVYLQNYNTRLVGYLKDEQSFKQLEDVLGVWIPQLMFSLRELYDEIDSVSYSESPDEIQRLIKKVKDNPKASNYFFENIKGVAWLKPLLSSALFCMDNPSELYTYVKNNKELFLDADNIEYSKIVYETIKKIIRSETPDIVKINAVEIFNIIPFDLFKSKDVGLIKRLFKPVDYGSYLIDRLVNIWLANVPDTCRSTPVYESIVVETLSLAFTPKKEVPESFELVVESYIIEEIWQKFLPVLSTSISKKLVLRLRQILRTSQFFKYPSYMDRTAIEKHEQNQYSLNESCNGIIDVMRTLLDTCLGSVKDDELVKDLLKSNVKILKRFGLYAIDKFSAQYKDIVEEVLTNKNNYFDYELKYEMYHLLKRNFSGLTKEKQSEIENMLCGLSKSKNDVKSRYLQAIKDVSENANAVFISEHFEETKFAYLDSICSDNREVPSEDLDIIAEFRGKHLKDFNSIYHKIFEKYDRFVYGEYTIKGSMKAVIVEKLVSGELNTEIDEEIESEILEIALEAVYQIVIA